MAAKIVNVTNGDIVSKPLKIKHVNTFQKSVLTFKELLQSYYDNNITLTTAIYVIDDTQITLYFVQLLVVDWVT